MSNDQNGSGPIINGGTGEFARRDYTDGSSATGTGNLPALSPQQDNAATASVDLSSAAAGAKAAGGVKGGIGAGFEDEQTSISGELTTKVDASGKVAGMGLSGGWTQRAPHIEPEVTRALYYWPNGTTGMFDADRSKPDLDRQPMSAQIAYVHENGKINLSVTDHAGNQFGVVNINLVQPGEPAPAIGGGHYATWTPHQIAAAARGQGGAS